MGLGNHTETITVGSRLMQRNIDKTADNETLLGGAAAPIVLTQPTAVTSWVKTDANTAAGDVAGASTIATGKVDVWWNGGMRYGVDCVRTVNALALDGGAGTDFPSSADTTVVVANQQQVNVSIDGDLAEIVGVLATVPAHLDFQDSAGDSIRALTLVANEPDMWDSDEASNPYTGDPITKAMTTNGTLAWVTSTAYVVGDVRTNSTTFYKCLVAHTSGTFATDLAAGDWVAVTATLEIIALQDSTP
jgi:hypothetical protein